MLDSITIEPACGRHRRCSTGWSILQRVPRRARTARPALAEAEQRPACAPRTSGHDHGLLHRAQRRAVVADDLGRLRTRRACCWRVLDDPALARGHAAAGARRARPAAARPLEHHGGQRLGRAGHARSSRRRSSRRRSRATTTATLGAGAAAVDVGRSERRPARRSPGRGRRAGNVGASTHERHRPALGHGPGRAACRWRSRCQQRLSHHAHGDAGRAGSAGRLDAAATWSACGSRSRRSRT